MNYQCVVVFGLCCMGLSACSTLNSEREYSYETSGGYYDDTNPTLFSYSSYSPSYDNYLTNQVESVGNKEVNVPESYHVGFNHAPVPARDRDRHWVSEQSPEGYTIELADGDKASQVAKKLVQAPKKERMAEVPYFRNGNQYYKGLYGTYSTYEAAKKALEDLPDSLKQEAGVKRWGEVQSAVGE